jgi:hypothetical protein
LDDIIYGVDPHGCIELLRKWRALLFQVVDHRLI